MRIIEMIKNLFNINKKKKNLLIEKTVENKRKSNFIQNLDLRGIQESMELQLKLEEQQISVDDLSIFEILDLIDLYNKQLNIV